MIGFFKNLFNRFFKRKPVTKNIIPPITRMAPAAEAKIPELTEREQIRMIEKAVAENQKRVRKQQYIPGMKNNRLHIEYSGDSGKNGGNSFIHDGKIMKAGKMYKGRIDSLRCTNLERATQIVRTIQSYCIKRAIFKDYTGQEFKIA